MDAGIEGGKCEEQNAVQFLRMDEWRSLTASLRLSQRESDIAALLLLNKTEATMAVLLGISVHTVHSHLERLFRKLRVRSRCGVVARLFEAYVAVHTRTAGPLEPRPRPHVHVDPD